MGQTIETKCNLAKDTLDRFYQNVIESKKPKPFFENLVDYITFIKDDDILKDIVPKYNLQKEDYLKKFKVKTKIVQEELNSAYNKIIGLLKQNNIQHLPEINEWRNNYFLIITPEDALQNNYIKQKKDKLDIILKQLFKNRKIRQSIEKIVWQNEKPDIEFSYAKSYFEYDDEKKDVVRLYESQPWFLWEKLFSTNKLYSEYGKTKQNFLEQKSIFLVYFPQIKYELDQIAQNAETTNFQFFNQSKTHEQLKKFNCHLNQVINDLIIDETKPNKSFSIVKQKNIKKIYFVKPDDNHIGKNYKVVVNDNYINSFEVSRHQKCWDFILNIIEGKELLIYKNKTDFDYFNSGKKNKLYTKTGYQPCQILKINNKYIIPNIELNYISSKKFQTNYNKQKNCG